MQLLPMIRTAAYLPTSVCGQPHTNSAARTYREIEPEPARNLYGHMIQKRTSILTEFPLLELTCHCESSGAFTFDSDLSAMPTDNQPGCRGLHRWECAVGQAPTPRGK